MNRTSNALIIGGGIAGTATAMALQKAGVDSAVYEAHPTGADGIGAFLTLASNGVDALRVLGADEPVLRASFPTPKITLRNSTGKRLGESRTGSLSDGTTSQTLKRADLYRVLYEEAVGRGLHIEHGKRLIAAEEVGDHVRAVFADGSEAVGDMLIGCDGVHSTVRRVIDPKAPAPTYSGLITNGGYARGVLVDMEPGSYEMIFGRRAFFGYARAPDDEVWWFANVPRSTEPARGEIEAVDPDGWKGRLLDLFADDAGPAASLVEATPAPTGMSSIHALPHLPNWHRGRILVMGDAAHAPSPTSGQGASLSIEDAVVLAKCIRDLPDAQAAFTWFEELRRPRVERIIKWAARVNNSKAAGPIGRVIRDAIMPVIMKIAANSRATDGIYDYHIDWDALSGARA
jgi:2-polyprenyl-6-methoxyphenol hydroxylase-like FAD-dependent oxidoreductase